MPPLAAHLALLCKRRRCGLDNGVLDEPDAHDARRAQLLRRCAEAVRLQVKVVRDRERCHLLGQLQRLHRPALVGAIQHALDLCQLVLRNVLLLEEQLGGAVSRGARQASRDGQSDPAWMLLCQLQRPSGLAAHVITCISSRTSSSFSTDSKPARLPSAMVAAGKDAGRARA